MKQYHSQVYKKHLFKFSSLTHFFDVFFLPYIFNLKLQFLDIFMISKIQLAKIHNFQYENFNGILTIQKVNLPFF